MSDFIPPVPEQRFRSHVVILGAGASRACCPQGDTNGRKLPVIADFIETLGLRPILEDEGVYVPEEKFEALYSRLAANPNHVLLVRKLESEVLNYFANLHLPKEPTLYDRLVLSLRAKDVIISFNWDPFLIQAVKRCMTLANPPTCLFVHGNVAIGYCARHDKISLGDRGNSCGQCYKPLIDSRLLYPVTHKDYNTDPIIKSFWKTAQEELRDCFLLTVFGYGAPQTDVEAVTLLKEGWGDVQTRPMEETEIIDIRPEKDLLTTWSPFIHTHHCQVHNDFYDSMTAMFPRRSVEMMRKRLINAEFVDEFPMPKEGGWKELREWVRPFVEQEKAIGE